MDEQKVNFTDARTLPKAYNKKNLSLLKDAVEVLLGFVSDTKKERDLWETLHRNMIEMVNQIDAIEQGRAEAQDLYTAALDALIENQKIYLDVIGNRK